MILASGYVSEERKETAPPLHTTLNYWDLVPRLSTHIVVRGTVLADTTRCAIYEVEEPEYVAEAIRRQFKGWTHNFCFSDVRVNEYLLGVGPPMLSVITDLENPPRPDYPGPSLEQTD